MPSIIVGLGVGLIPFAKLLARHRYASILFLAVVLFSFWAIKSQRPGRDLDVRYYSEGLLGQLLVVDDHRPQVNDRILFVNRIGQTYVDKATFNSRWDYPACIAVICSKFPQGSDALVLGLGGGSVANALQNRFGFKVDAIELDQRIAEVAHEQFVLSANVNVIVDDARHYLERSKKKYEVIVFDVYRGESPAPHVFTLESLEKTKSLLKPDGLIIVNFNGFLDGEIGKAARSIYKTLVAAGLETRIISEPGPAVGRNTLFVASKNKQDLHTLRDALTNDGKPMDIETLSHDPEKLDLRDAVVLTDNKPILELLNISAGNVWRQSYIRKTKRFYNEGVPLFR